MQPAEIWAIDWGAKPKKRQLCRAVPAGKRWVIEAPRALTEEPRALRFRPGALVAFDCPLGLPASYAEKAGITSFRGALRTLGTGRFERFWDIARTPDEIAIERPFYPAGTGAKQEELERVLGPKATWLRPCDRATGAGPLFWTLGPKQVGASAITIWRDVLQPQVDGIALWPFDGPLSELLRSGRTIVAEMYPAFLLKTLGWFEPVAKRTQAGRAAVGRFVVEKHLEGLDAIAVRDKLLDGFGPGPDGEDPFDATVAAIALVKLLQRGGIPEPDEASRRVEGWLLGL